MTRTRRCSSHWSGWLCRPLRQLAARCRMFTTDSIGASGVIIPAAPTLSERRSPREHAAHHAARIERLAPTPAVACPHTHFRYRGQPPLRRGQTFRSRKLGRTLSTAFQNASERSRFFTWQSSCAMTLSTIVEGVIMIFHWKFRLSCGSQDRGSDPYGSSGIRRRRCGVPAVLDLGRVPLEEKAVADR